MLVDARMVPAGTIILTDYCIIGAGPAGTTLAMDLVNTGAKVLMLESGTAELDNRIQDLNDGEISGRPYPLSSSRLRQLGGTPNHWTGHCYKFVERDFAAKEWLNAPEWPIELSDVEPYYGAASKLVLFSDAEKSWSTASWRKKLKTEAYPFEGSVFRSRLEYRSPILPRTGRSFAYYHPGLVASANCDLYQYATVTGIVADPATRKISEVAVVGPGQSRFKVAARITILAAGGIENARLLLASKSLGPHGLGNEQDQVGRYFTDHVFFQERFLRNPSVAPDRLLAWNDLDAMTKVIAHLIPKDEVLRAERMHDILLRILPVYPPETPEVAAAKRSFAGNISLKDLGTALSGFGTLAGKAWDKLWGDDFPLENAIQVRIEPPPIASSRITLTRDLDMFGVPKAHLYWDLPDDTKMSARRAVELLAQETGKHHLGRVQATFKPQDDWPGDLEVGYHHCCTTRMSADPKAGVVDRNCKVHGIENLYVAGSSVFTTAGSGSPTMTLVALSLRLADHLKGLPR